MMANHDKWIELCSSIRSIYQSAIASSTASDKDDVTDKLNGQLKHLVDSLWDDDWQQLLIRISVLIRDLVMEACNRLKNVQNVEGLPVIYLRGLLDSYDAFCSAAKNFSPYVSQLDDLLQKRFAVNFEFLNKYLFHACFYLDPFLQNNVPLYISQTQSSNQDLIHTYLAFDEEMTDIASRWLDVKKLILKYGKKRATDKKGSMILEVWESYREHREIAANKKWIKRENLFGKNDVGEFDVQLLSLLDDITNRFKDIDLKIHAKNSDKQCKNCNTDILCNCDDCSIKHILTCGLHTPPMSPGDKSSGPTHIHNQAQFLQQLTASSKANFLKLMTDKVFRNTLKMDIERKSKQKTKCENQNNGKTQCTNKNNPIITARTTVKITEATKKKDVPSEELKPKCPDEILKNNIPTNLNNEIVKSKTQKSNDAPTEKSDTTKNTIIHQKKTVIKDGKLSRVCSCIVDSKNGNTNVKKKDDISDDSNNDKQKNAQNMSRKCMGGFCKKGALKTFCLEHEKNHEMLRHCDCAHDEGFEALAGHINVKYNKMRDRLRSRLNEKRSNAVKENAVPNKIVNNTNQQNKPKEGKKEKEEKPTEQKKNDTVPDTRDIKELLNFIEGVDITKKEISAKNAAKKQKRLEKKLREKQEKEAEERRIAEEKRIAEERRIAEEKRIAEEIERRKELERQQALQAAKTKQHKSKNKNGRHNNNNSNNENSKQKSLSQQIQSSNLHSKIQENSKTGPMVTIKRIMEGSNKEPTVTITLKGSTPDKDKLLYTLVNGQSDSNKGDEKQPELSNRQKKKLRKMEEQARKELEALVAQSEKMPVKTQNKESNKQSNKQSNKTQNSKNNNTNNGNNNNKANTNKNKTPEPENVSLHSKSETMLNLQMLKLPPGITITKVEGPTVNRKININSKPAAEKPNTNHTITTNSGITRPADNRSGIIVVDTVKLKEELPDEKKNTNNTTSTNSKKKKNKKKNKNKKGDTNDNNNENSRKTVHITAVSGKNANATKQNSQILTLKNPMFYQLQEQLEQEKLIKNESTNHLYNNGNVQQNDTGTCQQASIIKGANGMVTIRSPRLGTINTSSVRNAPFMSLAPAVGTPVLSELKPIVGTNTATYTPSYATDGKRPFNAQEILSSLPGIEITKINKNTIHNKSECKKAFQPADVSIIPTNLTNGVNGDTYKLFYDNSDWSLESVFDPKDIKEDEVLDADELELEAFKRFCQQSVPPERKEKVQYLNVKDIILKKKASSSSFS